MVDGDTRWGAFLRVALPLARPGLAATAIFCLIISWNEFLLALILTLTEQIADPADRHRRPRDPVHDLLGRDQRRRLHGLHSDHDLRLHRPEASRARTLLRRRQGLKPWPRSDSSGVTKKFGEFRRRRRSQPRDQGQGIPRPARAVRLRQDDDDAHGRGPRGSHRRRHLYRRRPGQRRPAEISRRRHGLPVLRALSAPDGRGEHRLPPEDPEGAAGGAQAAGHRGGAARRARRAARTACRRSSPAASASAWRSPAPSSARRGSS